MQTIDSQKVVKRFFQALYHLKSKHVIRGKKTFTEKFEINRWNMNTLEKELLLTGRGEIMARSHKTKEGTK